MEEDGTIEWIREEASANEIQASVVGSASDRDATAAQVRISRSFFTISSTDYACKFVWQLVLLASLYPPDGPENGTHSVFAFVDWFYTYATYRSILLHLTAFLWLPLPAGVESASNPNLLDETDKENKNSSNGEELDISEYERNLRENAKQAMDLVGDLCDRSDQITEQQKGTLLKLEEEQRERQKVAEEMKKVAEQNEELSSVKQQVQFWLIFSLKLEQRVAELSSSQHVDDSDQGGKSQSHLTGAGWQRVDSVSIGEDELSRPNSAAFLQNTDKIVVADEENGLVLFSMQSGLITKVTSEDWKWPQSVICTPDNKILISAMAKSENNGKIEWKRNLLKFDENLEFLSRIEGPKWIQDETVASEHLCIAPNGYIYLSVTGETFSALYELATDGKWSEICHKRGIKISNVQVLAAVGPITELLVVERCRGYIWLLSIRESSACARNMIAAVEKPGALCIDERHQIFIHDTQQSKIRQVDSRVFEPVADVALASKDLTFISSCRGLLAAVYCARKIVRIHEYSLVQ
ncbi:unnamed protein product [Gongylonema pulchrum]|uniref:PQQ_3 domain-containing protein n=1 Tax=Gongylonema pulchrum TaxID=637853 RepID=A0A183DP93_9BILA|nr:unnamed protein product [Gongylonema pulchrum]